MGPHRWGTATTAAAVVLQHLANCYFAAATLSFGSRLATAARLYPSNGTLGVSVQRTVAEGGCCTCIISGVTVLHQ